MKWVVAPAAAAYEEQLGLLPGELPVDKFWDTSISHPFGLLQSDGSAVICVARSKTEQGILNVQGCVPPSGSAVQVMSGNADTLLQAVDEEVGTSTEMLPEPGVLLAFSCAAREDLWPTCCRRTSTITGGRRKPTYLWYVLLWRVCTNSRCSCNS